MFILKVIDNTFSDIAEILGHKDTKVISDEHLSDLVRQIAVNCNVSINEYNYLQTIQV